MRNLQKIIIWWLGIPSFEKMVKKCPKDIKDILLRCRETPQNPFWHPEGNVLKHTRIVYNRARKLKNLDFCIAAFFHDLGKPSVTVRNSKGSWSAPGHELVSTQILEKFQDWVEQIGGDYKKIHELVFYHMRVKIMDEMKLKKQEEMKNHIFFNEILEFSQLDNMQNLTKEELHG